MVYVSNIRLVMRYVGVSAFSFNNLRLNASDQAIHQLATHIASLQSETPRQITRITTRQLV